MDEKSRPIHIRFHPFRFDQNEHVVEKADSTGVKRRYVRGVSSGIMKDGVGERMTLNCIKSMMEQGNSGDVLLYSGLHGVNFIDDLGMLTESEIVDQTNWLTTYRLYDQHDSMPQATVERGDVLFKQLRGLSPYKRPIQKGFSVEGKVLESDILEKTIEQDGSWTNRVIDNMTLDGVVVVTRPAYTDSCVTAVHKCLNELTPIAEQILHTNIKNQLVQKIQDNNNTQNFYQKYFELNSVFEEKIFDIMKVKDKRSEARLNILLEEYTDVMKNLILQNAETFRPVSKSDIKGQNQPEKGQQLMKQLVSTMRLFSTSIAKRIGE